MKKIIINLLIITSLAALITSCEDIFGDYMEKPPGADVTEDVIFSSQAQVEIFLASCYEQALFNPWEETKYYNGSSSWNNDIYDNLPYFSGITDEGEHEAGWYPSNNVNLSTNTANELTYDLMYRHRHTAIRMTNILIERIDDVPDASETYKTQIKAEARHLRAELHFINFKRYGGVSLIARRLNPSEVEEMKIPRSSVDSTVQFIVEDLDYAISILPDSYSSNMRGRITKGASLALKSRVLLYAASPLFNTSTPPISMPDAANNRLLCYGDYDVNRWQKAADAAKAVLDWAPSGNIHLITDQGVDKNYRYVWEQNDNAEIILANKQANNVSRANVKRPFRYYLARAVGGLQGIEVTQNFVEYYEKRDGTPMVWPDEDDNLTERYEQLDYRFKQTIGYNGSYWNPDRGFLAMYLGPGQQGEHSTPNKTGYFVKKWIPDALNTFEMNVNIDLVRYRLAEAYLNYAEAMNEVKGPVAEAYNAINTIRERSGMPPLPAGLSKEEFRERVHKERAIELAFENHRWWDLRRWIKLDEVLSKPFYGLKIYKNQPETDPLTFNYVKYVFENRVSDPKYYHDFFQRDEVNLGYLVQNPGW